MTYDIQEHSIAGARPFYLYQFSTGPNVTYLAATEQNVVRGGITWTASSLSHSEVEQTGSVEKSELEFIFPLSDEFARDFLQPATQITTVTVSRSHWSDASEQIRSYWKGRLIGATSKKYTISLIAESVFTSLRRPGCRVRVQRSCRHDHYGAVGCTLNRGAWAIPGNVTTVSGSVLTIPEAALYPAGRFKAGIVSWQGRFGFVQDHSGSTIVLVSDIPDLDEATLPQPITIAPGCDRSLDSTFGCTSFGNQLNYGGFRWLPSQNPFSGSIV